MTVKTTQPGMVMYTANGLAEGLHLGEGLSENILAFVLKPKPPLRPYTTRVSRVLFYMQVKNIANRLCLRLVNE